MKVKLKSLAFLILSFILVCLCTPEIGIAQGTQNTECVITIYRVQLIDSIETASPLEGKADWYYNLTVTDSERTSYASFDGDLEKDDLVFNNDHAFLVKSLQVTIRVYLYEDDAFGYETADISSNSTRRYFVANYSLQTNSFIVGSDIIYQDEGYYKTSGNFDGTTETDDNDANLWFMISDNYESPVANAGTNRYIFFGDKINFDASQSSASSGSEIVKYQWDFENDGVFDAEDIRISFTYPEKGNYKVLLKVTDDYGQISTDTCSIRVTDPIAPIAVAGVDQTITLGQKVTFDASWSTTFGSRIIKYQWDFNKDGIFDAERRKTSFTYSEKGIYTVLLKITDDYGQTSTSTCIVTVCNSLPSINFTRLPLEPTIRDTINFSEKCNDTDGTLVSWHWDFGDGTTSNERNPSHQYSQKGTYSVSLKATDNDNDWNITTTQITIFNIEPRAIFSSSSMPNTGDTVEFSDNSTDPENAIVERFWEFGDGSFSTTKNPSHVFETTGEYVVKLTVTDDEGETDTASLTVHVSELSILQEYQVPIIITVVAIAAVITFLVLRRVKPVEKRLFS